MTKTRTCQLGRKQLPNPNALRRIRQLDKGPFRERKQKSTQNPERHCLLKQRKSILTSFIDNHHSKALKYH